MKDPRNTDTFAHFVHIHDPLAVPPKVTFTTTPAFTEADLLEVARRAATNAALVAGRNNAAEVVRDFLEEREASNG